MTGDFTIAYLWSLFGVVAFGAVIPIVPTGAAVSVAAVLSERESPLFLLVVIAVGAAGAYTGDVITYVVLRLAGDGLAQRVGWLKGDAPVAETLERIRAEVEEREVRVLLLSRLVPGGRVPVLLAAALGGYSRRRFAIADVGAATLWATVYAAIGLAGRLFPEPWQGIVAAMAIILGITVVERVRDRRRRRSGPAVPALAVETD